MAGRIQAQLWEVALDAHGYVTSDDARDLGVNVVELGKLSARKQLSRVGYGIYRFPQFPVSAWEPYMLAVLWTGSRGVLSHTTAIDLYDLGDVNPDTIHVTVPVDYRPRRQGGELYTVHHQDLAGTETRRFEGIPIVKPAIAIDQAIDGHVASHLVRQAIDIARQRNLITKTERDRLTRKIGGRP
jgi:predicted transcriptional regulator of viral defense system